MNVSLLVSVKLLAKSKPDRYIVFPEVGQYIDNFQAVILPFTSNLFSLSRMDDWK